jgi:hypothetical protein
MITKNNAAFNTNDNNTVNKRKYPAKKFYILIKKNQIEYND